MILDYLSKSSKINKAFNAKRISKSNKNFNMYQIASDYLKNNRMSFVVLPTLYDAQTYYDGLSNLLDEESVLFFPVDDMALASQFIASNEFKFERINTILSLLKGEPKVILTTANGLIYKNLNKEAWKKSILNLKVGDTYNVKELKNILTNLGYNHANVVTSTGEFSFRGSIIDFYPLNYPNPVRLDFFDDELDTIKLFDPESQRTIMKINSINLTPIIEFFYDDTQKDNAIKVLKEDIKTSNREEVDLLYKDIHKLDLRHNLETVSQYIDLFDKSETIISFVDNPKVYVINEEKIVSLIDKSKTEVLNHYESIGCPKLSKYMSFDFNLNLESYDTTYIDTLVEHSSSLEINTEEIEKFYGNFNLIAKDVTRHWSSCHVILNINSSDKLKRLKEFFLENMLKYKTVKDISELDYECINIVNDSYVLTLSLPSDGIYILAEDTLFSNSIERQKVRYKSTFYEASKISKHEELAEGDYVVHINHGIGIYETIKTMELSGLKRDYLKINYANGESLYIPIEQLNLIKKYTGADGRKPELTKLGSASWTKTKQKVKEKVEELSRKLIEIYAQREAAEGFSFAPDGTEQLEFESEFKYEETMDQLSAIKAIKTDMESSRVMDRLVCGDVGFGKTEVALRASFKAVMSGKQVCYLAPTTVLTRQHYHTFKDRMEKYGVRVELLNRFVSSKEKNKILKDLAFGTVDILIGTHRVLSDDVKFKDLGLLITDEEHRFGVMHKEKIKEMKINVDSIMLTATPIPRTLQMSLLGIKELSMIETPPKNRYPVQTYVTPRHDSIIAEAIERELLRGGQVFYLYNYTEDISDQMVKISKMVPHAKVCYAHGKMNKNQLEEVIQAFIEHEYDVLVSTTIIETGIDIPSANTLIIHDADRLGLSQLYQIRGRIGRSDKIAYAYLMYEPRKILTPEAEKRLETIKEFTELGSGFKIAMRDLSIRGAGDLLGQEQSGFINSVGLDLYMQILDETLKKIKSDKKDEKPKSSLGKAVLSNRYIPDSYNVPESIKIEIHNKIAKIESMEEFDSLSQELIDRFGPVSEELQLYMYEKLFYSLCQKCDVENIDIKMKQVSLTISKEKTQTLNGTYIYKTAYEMSNNFLLSYHDQKVTITFKTSGFINNRWLPLMCKYLTKIA